MSYLIMIVGLIWLISGGLMTYQSYLYNKQCKEFQEKGKVIVGKNRGGFFSEKVNVFLAVDKSGTIVDAAKLENIAFLHKPKLSPLGLVVGSCIKKNKFEYSLLDTKVKEALRFASESYKLRGGEGQ